MDLFDEGHIGRRIEWTSVLEAMAKEDHTNTYWSEAKKVLNVLIYLLEYVHLPGCAPYKTSQRDIISQVYQTYELHTRQGYSYMIGLFDVISDAYRLSEKGRNEVVQKFSTKWGKFEDTKLLNQEFELYEANRIDANSENAVEQIKDFWIKNRETVEVTSIRPLLDNEDFIDTVLRLNVDITSKYDPHLTSQFLSIIKYVKNNSATMKHGNPRIGKVKSDTANNFAREIGPMLDKMNEQGINSIQKKVDELNRLGIKTSQGKKWMKTSAHRTLKRWEKIKDEEETKKSNSPKP